MLAKSLSASDPEQTSFLCAAKLKLIAIYMRQELAQGQYRSPGENLIIWGCEKPSVVNAAN